MRRWLWSRPWIALGVIFFLGWAALRFFDPAMAPYANNPAGGRPILRVAVTAQPSHLDPQRALTMSAITFSKALFEGLIRLGPSGEPMPALAKAWWCSPDQRSWHFFLRESLWSDGAPLTAADCVRGIERALGSRPQLEGAGLLMGLEGAEEWMCKGGGDWEGAKALGPQHLRLCWRDPQPHALRLVAHPAFSPAPARQTSIKEGLVCNGPFVQAPWQPGQPLLFAANPSFWDARRIQLDGIRFFLLEPSAAEQALYAGKIDWVGSPFGSLPRPATPEVPGFPDHNVPMVRTCWLSCNVTAGSLRDPGVRRHLADSLQTADVGRIAPSGWRVATELTPPEVSVGSPTLPGCWRGGSPPAEPVELILSSSADGVRIASYLKEALDRRGWDVHLRALEGPVFFKRLRSRQYQMALTDWISDTLAAEDFLQPLSSASDPTNRTGWSSPEASALWSRAMLEIGEARAATLRKAHAVMMEAPALYPLFYPSSAVRFSPALHGACLNPLGVADFSYLELGKDKNDPLQAL